MFRTLLLSIALLGAAALSPSDALAREPDGVAIGGGAMLGGLSGLVLQFRPGPVIIDVVAGVTFTSFDDDMSDDVLVLGAAAGVLFDVVKGRDTHLQLGGHLGFTFNSATDNAIFLIDVPLRVEHWFSERFSVQPQVGVLLSIDPNDSVSFGAGVNAGFFGGANFVFYLNEVRGGGGGAVAPQAAAF